MTRERSPSLMSIDSARKDSRIILLPSIFQSRMNSVNLEEFIQEIPPFIMSEIHDVPFQELIKAVEKSEKEGSEGLMQFFAIVPRKLPGLQSLPI